MHIPRHAARLSLCFGMIVALWGWLFNIQPAVAAPTMAPQNCTLTRTAAPGFIYDPAINSQASVYTGTVAITTDRGVGSTPLRVLNLATQDGSVVNGQTHPTIGVPWEDPAPARFQPTTAPLSWNAIGSVFGVTLDSWGNIYLAATSSFNSTTNPGRIYKVDTLTGLVSTFATVPGDSSGTTSNASLGNISTNLRNNNILVVSMDTGLIYRYSAAGALLSTYDHGTQGRPAAGMESIPNIGTFGNNSATIKGRRVWAVEVYDPGTGPRAYYSVVWRYNGQAPQSGDYTNPPYNVHNININDEDTNNQVWSVALDATTGEFLPASARREFSTVYPGIWQSTASENQNAFRFPISDITFIGSSGWMLAATRGAQDDGLNSVTAHEGQVIAALPAGTTWQLNATLFDGFGQIANRNDGTGGVAWDPTALNGGGRVWIQAEALYEALYNGPGPIGNQTYNTFGIIGMPDEGAPVDLARANGLLLDGNGINNQEKQTGGDVEIGCIPLFDYGDQPSTTLLANNGPRHLIHLNTNGTPAADQIYLGSLLDAETNGQPTTNANGDDSNGVDDEDGIVANNLALWNFLTGGSVTATVGGGNGWLVGWIDWNNNGIFADSEMVFSQAVSTGSQTISLSVPLGATPQLGVRARFRLFTSQAAAQQVGIRAGGTNEAAADLGPAANGEIEDYLFTVSLGITLERFEAVCVANAPTPTINVLWETGSETPDTLGFNLYRAESLEDERTRLNDALIPAQNPGGGGYLYEWQDDTVNEGHYLYWLEDVNMQGGTEEYGPVNAAVPCVPTAVTVTTFHAEPIRLYRVAPIAGLLLLLLLGVILSRYQRWPFKKQG